LNETDKVRIELHNFQQFLVKKGVINAEQLAEFYGQTMIEYLKLWKEE